MNLRGHGRLLRGLTPPDLVDEVLERRIVRVDQLRKPVASEDLVDELNRELRIARRLARVGIVLIVLDVLALLVVVGVRLLLQ